MNSKKETYVGIVLALLGAMLFSSKAILVKLSYSYGVDKMSLLAMRMGFALPIYFGIALWQLKKGEPHEKMTPLSWTWLLISGIIGYYFASFLDFWGLQYINASLERLILFLYPTMTVILGALILKRKITQAQILAIIIAYLGIVVAFWDKLTINGDPDFLFGASLVFFSALTFSFYLIGSESLLSKLGVLRFTSYCMIISCVVMLIHYAVVRENDILDLPWQGHLLGFLVAMINTVIPSFLISNAIYRIGAATTSILSSIGPVFVLVVAYFVLGEEITTFKVFGTLIVIVGVLIISLKKGEEKEGKKS